MTIEKQNQINLECRRPLVEQRQAVRAYRKRNQLSEAGLLERCWEMDAREGLDCGNN